ncbi:MAG: hypothetical protein ACRC30_04990 [Clostridium sp.]
MRYIDIECTKNTTFSFRCREGINKENIKIGVDKCVKYWSYLYFNILEVLQKKEVVEAKLILYKIPSRLGKQESEYYIVPAKEFVSKYSYYYKDTINIDNDLGVEFITKGDLCCVEIDITKIIEAMIKGEIENKGVLLLGNEKSKYIELSGCQEENCDKPFVRVRYEEHSYVGGPSVNLPVKIKIIND